jgi:hypothetical protein
MVTSPKGLGPEKGYLARASSIYKRQTRPLVREGAPEKRDRNCKKILDTKTYWLTDRQSQCDFDFNFDFEVQNVVDWRFSEPSESKIRSWVRWDSEPRVTVLARASINLSVSQSVSIVQWQKLRRAHNDLDPVTARVYTYSCWNYGATNVAST